MVYFALHISLFYGAKASGDEDIPGARVEEVEILKSEKSKGENGRCMKTENEVTAKKRSRLRVAISVARQDLGLPGSEICKTRPSIPFCAIFLLGV